MYVSADTGECLSVGIERTPVCIVEYNTSDQGSVEQARKKLQQHLGLNHLPLLYTSDPEYRFSNLVRRIGLKLASFFKRSPLFRKQ